MSAGRSRRRCDAGEVGDDGASADLESPCGFCARKFVGRPVEDGLAVVADEVDLFGRDAEFLQAARARSAKVARRRESWLNSAGVSGFWSATRRISFGFARGTIDGVIEEIDY